MAKRNAMASAKWLMTPGLLGYIVDSYSGVEEIPKSKKVRRVFDWLEGDEVIRGNAEAFVLHLGIIFGLELGPEKACFIHAVLRELGEVVLHKKKEARDKPDPNSPRAGKFRQPDPDKRVVRRRHKTNE